MCAASTAAQAPLGLTAGSSTVCATRAFKRDGRTMRTPVGVSISHPLQNFHFAKRGSAAGALPQSFRGGRRGGHFEICSSLMNPEYELHPLRRGHAAGDVKVIDEHGGDDADRPPFPRGPDALPLPAQRPNVPERLQHALGEAEIVERV